MRPANMLFVLMAAAMLLAGCTPRAPDAALPKAEQERLLTWMAPRGAADIRDEEAEAKLAEYLGVDLNIIWVDEAMYSSIFETSAAAQKFPKAVTVPSRLYYEPLVRSSIKAGHFWEIGPYLKEYPNLRGLSSDILARTAVEGKIYGLYHYEPSVHRTLYYREDWLQETGMDPPRTPADFKRMLHIFTRGDPDGNGKHDTVGMIISGAEAEAVIREIAVWHGAPNGWGFQRGDLLPDFMHPGYLDALKYLRELYLEGLINADFPLMGEAKQLEWLRSGKAGVYYGPVRHRQMLESWGFKPIPEPIRIEEARTAGGPGFSAVHLFPVRSIATEDELKRILGDFDRMLDAEAAPLIRGGLDILGTVQHKPPGGSFLPDDLHVVANPVWGLDSDTYDDRGAVLKERVDYAAVDFILGSIDQAAFEQAVEEWRLNGGALMIHEFSKDYLLKLSKDD